MKITVYFDHNGILRGLCGEVVADSFYNVDIDGVIEVVELSKEEMAPGNRRIVSLVKVSQIVKNELSGNSEQLP